MRRLVLVAALLSATVQAQPVAPSLTEVQKLQVQLALSRLEAAQMRLQLASDEFQRARLEAQDMLASLDKPGWRLNIQKFEYEVKPEPGSKD
jgi:hypothetical protein